MEERSADEQRGGQADQPARPPRTLSDASSRAGEARLDPEIYSSRTVDIATRRSLVVAAAPCATAGGLAKLGLTTLPVRT